MCPDGAHGSSPAVSTAANVISPISACPYLISRVVCDVGVFLTITAAGEFTPTSRLKSMDLPTFGFPSSATMAGVGGATPGIGADEGDAEEAP